MTPVRLLTGSPPPRAAEMATFFEFVQRTYRCYMAVDDAGDERITSEFGAGMQRRAGELRAANAATAEVGVS